MKIYKTSIHLTFTEEILGTANSNPEIYADYIASKAADTKGKPKDTTDELEAVEAAGVQEDKTKTIFLRTPDGTPCLFDYQLKGFFKGACVHIRKIPDTVCSKVKAYKRQIDGLVFVSPRMIELEMPEDGEMGDCQRPLRAETPMGERIALAHSETAPAGTEIDFCVTALTKEMHDLVLECLRFGHLSGIGQWRNSGKGRFIYEIVADKIIESDDFDPAD